MKQSGFTLVEVLIATGLMCALSIGMMKIMQTHGMSVKTGEMDSEIMSTMAQVARIMGSTNGCNATLANTLTKIYPSTTLNSAGADVSSIRIKNANEYLKVGSKLVAGLTLSKISVKVLQQNFDPESGYGSGVIEMTFSKEGGFGGKTIVKSTDFYAKFTSLKYYSVLSSDLLVAKNSIKTVCQSDLGTSNLIINIIKTGLGSSIGECMPVTPTVLYVEHC